MGSNALPIGGADDISWGAGSAAACAAVGGGSVFAAAAAAAAAAADGDADALFWRGLLAEGGDDRESDGEPGGADDSEHCGRGLSRLDVLRLAVLRL